MSYFTLPDPHHATLLQHVSYDIGSVVILILALAVLFSPFILYILFIEK